MSNGEVNEHIEKLRIENARLKESLVYFKSRFNETAQRFFLLVRNLPDIVYLLDTHGNILFISKTITAYGYSPEELIGMNIFELVAPEDHERAAWHVNERRRGDRRTAAFPLKLKQKKISESQPENDSESNPQTSLFDLYAEGRYTMIDGDTLTFTGTLGIARDVSTLPGTVTIAGNTIDTAKTANLIPVCSGCKRIRLSDGEWIDLETFLQDHCDMQITHSICPRCSSRFYPDTSS